MYRHHVCVILKGDMMGTHLDLGRELGRGAKSGSSASKSPNTVSSSRYPAMLPTTLALASASSKASPIRNIVSVQNLEENQNQPAEERKGERERGPQSYISYS